MSDKNILRLDYKNKSKLLRFAAEIATYNNPRNVANQLLAFIESNMKNSGNRN